MEFKRPDDAEITFRFTYIHKGERPHKEDYEEIALEELRMNLKFIPWREEITKETFKLTTEIIDLGINEYDVTIIINGDYL